MIQLSGQLMAASLSFSVWAIREHLEISSSTETHHLFTILSYGFGQHADYVFGWEGDSLQKAMDTCTGGTGIPWDCPVLTLQDVEAMNTCRQGEKVPEVTENKCAHLITNV